MTSKRRRWARWTTGSSFLLLVLAVVSLVQVYPLLVSTFDPESNYVVKMGPEEEKGFELEGPTVLTALRVTDGDTPTAELRLIDHSGSEIIGRAPGILDSDRPGSDSETFYAPVRIFDVVGSGTYTLHNDAEESLLWLVDDGDLAAKIDSNPWLYMFYIGCCLGLPLGLIGLVLAVMVWSDKRKAPDQYVVIQDGSVILTDVDSVQAMQAQEGDIIETGAVGDVPGPFIGEDASVQKAEAGGAEQEWKKWDEG
ncbi:MAG: hypothetical protein VX909_02075 [Candidatus Thermoplasmatota archaeon]|nr:hypothetical protein [Candidatus Thermoplasmatota archaeon]MEE2650787.1 hypothetical protein [Candidatus Thermoplasmatota archaeon]